MSSPEELGTRLLAAARNAPAAPPWEAPPGFAARIAARALSARNADAALTRFERLCLRAAAAAVLVCIVVVLASLRSAPAEDDAASSLRFLQAMADYEEGP